MNDSTGPKLPKLPFFLGDAVCLGMAYLIYQQGTPPMGKWEMLVCVVTVAFGALLGVAPFLLEYRAAVKLTEAVTLTATVEKVRNLDHVANLIGQATAQWQGVHEESTKTLGLAKEITDRMTAEARAFSDFMQKANTKERATLRLEIEKLRRAENDWLQVLTRILDHVHALHQAALRSGQPSLVEQLGNFQSACHEASRRIGLIPFLATPGKPFDATNHRLADQEAEATKDARVSETIAAGYTYQGQLIRAALVSLQPGEQGNLPLADKTPASARSSIGLHVEPTRKRMDSSELAKDLDPSQRSAELTLAAKQTSLL